jgi:hypothetical protein
VKVIGTHACVTEMKSLDLLSMHLGLHPMLVTYTMARKPRLTSDVCVYAVTSDEYNILSFEQCYR